MRRSSHLRLLSGISCLTLSVFYFGFLSFPNLTHAALVNRTIDDTLGDPTTGFKPTFKPETAGIWEGNDCQVCAIQPARAEAFGGTWMAATYRPQEFPSMSFELEFTGIAIYVFFILANSQGLGVTTKTACHFFLDGILAGEFNHDPTPSRVLEYNALVYRNDRMTNTTHTLRVETAGFNEGLYVNFDYAIYTFDDGNNNMATITSEGSTPALPTATSEAPAGTNSSSGQGGTVDSTHPESSPKPALLGAIVGGIAAALIIIVATMLFTFWHCQRRRRRRRPGPQMLIDPPPSPLPASHRGAGNHTAEKEGRPRTRETMATLTPFTEYYPRQAMEGRRSYHRDVNWDESYRHPSVDQQKLGGGNQNTGYEPGIEGQPIVRSAVHLHQDWSDTTTSNRPESSYEGGYFISNHPFRAPTRSSQSHQSDNDAQNLRNSCRVLWLAAQDSSRISLGNDSVSRRSHENTQLSHATTRSSAHYHHVPLPVASGSYIAYGGIAPTSETANGSQGIQPSNITSLIAMAPANIFSNPPPAGVLTEENATPEELRMMRQQELNRQMAWIQAELDEIRNQAEVVEQTRQRQKPKDRERRRRSSICKTRATFILANDVDGHAGGGDYNLTSTSEANMQAEAEELHQLREQISTMRQQIEFLQSQQVQQSAWAQGLSDEPPPGYELRVRSRNAMIVVAEGNTDDGGAQANHHQDVDGLTSTGTLSAPSSP